MAYRFTNTEKWNDAWFCSLSQIDMLLFLYLCDNCDIAGFMEVNYKRWASDLNSSPETISKTLQAINKAIVFSNNKDCIYIINYIKHQKNFPLNENNKAHLGILRRFELYSYKFDIQDVKEFIEGASKGLRCSIGKGIGNGTGEEKKDIIELSIEFYNQEISNFDSSVTREVSILQTQYYNYTKLVTGKSDAFPETPKHFLSIEQQLTFDAFCKLKQLEKKINLQDLLKSKVNVLLNNEKYCKGKKSIYMTLIDYMNKDGKK